MDFELLRGQDKFEWETPCREWQLPMPAQLERDRMILPGMLGIKWQGCRHGFMSRRSQHPGAGCAITSLPPLPSFTLALTSPLVDVVLEPASDNFPCRSQTAHGSLGPTGKSLSSALPLKTLMASSPALFPCLLWPQDLSEDSSVIHTHPASPPCSHPS